MVIDSSAVIAILFDEPEAEALLSQIAAAEISRLSAASLIEVGLVLRRDATAPRRAAVDEMLRLCGADLLPYICVPTMHRGRYVDRR